MTTSSSVGCRRRASPVVTPATASVLFGSRAQGDARGGRIDLAVEGVSLPAAETLRRRIALLMELHERLGDQRIDVDVRRSGGPELSIHRQAEATGEPL